MNFFNKLINDIIENKKINFLVFSAVLLLLTVYMMYINSPLFPGDDFSHHSGRLNGLIAALKEGNFPWYINYNGLYGAGYFVKAFYCDITLLPFALIGVFTNGYVAYMSMLFGTTILCGLVTYVCVYKIYKNPLSASITAIIYTFCTYRLLDLYWRSAMGEVFTFIFLPVIVWGMYEIVKGDYKKWYILAIGYSLTIFSHLISSVILTVPIILFLIIYYQSLIKEPRRIMYLAIAGVATVILAAYYIFPMLEQMMSNDFYYKTRDSIPTVMGATRTVSYILDGFYQGTVSHLTPFITKIGIILTMAVATRIVVKKKSTAIRSADIFVIVGLIILFMITNIFPWGWFPFTLLNVMQYPWRLFIFPCFFFALAGGIYIANIDINNRRIMILLAAIVVSSAVIIKTEGQNYTFHIATRLNPQNGDIDVHVDINTNTNGYGYGACEYLPDKVPSIAYLLYQRKGFIDKQHEETIISNYNNQKGIISFDISTQNNELIEIPIVYYKGYEANMGSEKISLRESGKGLIELPVAHSGKVEVFYAGTIVQKVSTWISLIATLALCVYIYWGKRRKRENLNNGNTE